MTTDGQGAFEPPANELSEGANTQADLWDLAGRDWAELVAYVATPIWHADLDASRVTRGTRVVDLACGSGEALVLASLRGAETAGVDVSSAFLSIARERLPDADLRRGELEALPFDDASFDAAIAANAIMFAEEPTAALEEARRVLEPGGRLAVSVWGRDGACDYTDVMDAIYTAADLPKRDPYFPLGREGALGELLGAADFEVGESGTVSCPFVYPDEEAYVAAQAANGPAQGVIAQIGQEAFDEAITEAGEPYRRDDGSYRLENEYRYVSGIRPSS